MPRTGIGIVLWHRDELLTQIVSFLETPLVSRAYGSLKVENQMVSAERVLGYCRVPQEASLESEPGRKPKDDWPAKGAIEVRTTALCWRRRQQTAPLVLRLVVCPFFAVWLTPPSSAKKPLQSPKLDSPVSLDRPSSVRRLLCPQVRDMSMRYREDLPPVLKDLTLSIKGGSRVGVVGRTGAGKSSLIAALFRLVEYDKERCVQHVRKAGYRLFCQ